MLRSAFTGVYGLSVLLVVSIFMAGTVQSGAAKTTRKKFLRGSFSVTEVSSSHTDKYGDVAGISGEDRSSWMASLTGRYQRSSVGWSHEHRLDMKYGEVENEKNEDEIDVRSVYRSMLDTGYFLFANARVRSVFDTFGHPTKLNNSVGFGTFLLNSDTYGRLEVRLGPRASRSWNPTVEWDSYHEFTGYYSLELDSGRMLSELEWTAPTENPDLYTVPWDNRLISSLNGWLDIEYRFSLYYEEEVEEVATRSLSMVNLVYTFVD